MDRDIAVSFLLHDLQPRQTENIGRTLQPYRAKILRPPGCKSARALQLQLQTSDSELEKRNREFLVLRIKKHLCSPNALVRLLSMRCHRHCCVQQ